MTPAACKTPVALNVKLANPDSALLLAAVSVATAVSANPADPAIALGLSSTGPHALPHAPPQAPPHAATYGPQGSGVVPEPLTVCPLTLRMSALIGVVSAAASTPAAIASTVNTPKSTVLPAILPIA